LLQKLIYFDQFLKENKGNVLQWKQQPYLSWSSSSQQQQSTTNPLSPSHDSNAISTKKSVLVDDGFSKQDPMLITIAEYDLIRLEIQQRVRESWYINTLAVTIAALNILNLAIGAFSYLQFLKPIDVAKIVIQLSKEIVFLLIIFVDCATLNAKVDLFLIKLGNYVSWYDKSVSLWLYATLNPICFKLGGYVVTWNRIMLQVASVVIGVVFGVLKKVIVNQ
jgi:hypothetical protein